ncbi:hypothetical protein OOZ19_14735 [Saccharopolyspora sp. NFXS83]|uniref:hypothetical protein n=1 Tax=Saccharopolyspora sp. NFXS83 TaxID=2993560 RepID=UPI00224B48FB|nr:hypothetical protein [Saccharopolyspora sp. NFXS83]MCX2731499.1 hypothetical protein [Saccharopolyspora sp. NFXS83]
MAESTAFSPEDIKNAANAIGKLTEDMAAFQELKAHWPNAGQFETAQWLERIVDDRRNGLVAHAERLKNIFDNMKTDLTAIANDFENADGENADKIKAEIDDMRGHIDTAISSLDKGTEDEQHNFTEDPNVKPDDNSSDGDGYNDTLPA